MSQSAASGLISLAMIVGLGIIGLMLVSGLLRWLLGINEIVKLLKSIDAKLGAGK